MVTDVQTDSQWRPSRAHCGRAARSTCSWRLGWAHPAGCTCSRNRCARRRSGGEPRRGRRGGRAADKKKKSRPRTDELLRSLITSSALPVDQPDPKNDPRPRRHGHHRQGRDRRRRRQHRVLGGPERGRAQAPHPGAGVAGAHRAAGHGRAPPGGGGAGCVAWRGVVWWALTGGSVCVPGVAGFFCVGGRGREESERGRAHSPPPSAHLAPPSLSLSPSPLTLFSPQPLSLSSLPIPSSLSPNPFQS